MPFPAEAPTTIPLSWKQKQRVCVNAGLRCMNAPMVLLSLCSMVFSLPHLKWDEPIDHLELFAGVCSISRGEWEERRSAIAMDLKFGAEQDILSNVGFCNMVYQVLNLRPGAAMWAAPVCSTWIYLSLG
ncbi:unnamed protein product [Durusdinium trenchii]|uniref:Uncharacterized protein n=2 Tax=Durusdinium trenchii TaxID=1381693 RepID=A0ABP0NST5_9DINO